MKHVIIESFNSNTRLQLDSNNNPIWDYFTEPTLSILQTAYAEQKDNLEILETVIDPTKVEPNWGKFNRSALMSSVVGLILTTSSNQYAVDNLRSLISPAGYAGGLSKEDYPALQFIWGQIIDGQRVPPTVEMIVELNAIALASNMIFSFDTGGKILYVG